jgi:hypothetical protein
MTIYTDLKIIDDFEERHGIEETLRRARTFMTSYLEMMTDLPEPTRHSLEVAKRFSEGLLTSEDLANERKVVWRYLTERNASTDCRTPENAIIHAAFGPLTDHGDLKPGETPSERVSSFLDCANVFADHSDSVALLLESSFFE